jgi:hypothetical protein
MNGRMGKMPALLISTSMRPCFCAILSNALFTAFPSVMSRITASADPPASRIWFAVAAASASFRSTTATCAPASAKRAQVA